jgi:hypothetical protein
LYFIFFDCLINFIIKIIVNILDAFSVGKLGMVFKVCLFLLDRGDIGYESDGCWMLIIVFDGRDVSGGCPRSYWRFGRIDLVGVGVSSEGRLVKLDVGLISLIDCGGAGSAEFVHLTIKL